MNSDLLDIFSRLSAHFGPLNWWPADTPFEVAVGAILTQNTAWRNVEQALDNLRAAGVLEPQPLQELPREHLEELIRPAGFFRQKAERLQRFVTYLFARSGGDLTTLLRGSMEQLRVELLALKGIGPETADSILLYGGNHPSFVVDAYTRRLFIRLECLAGDETYEQIRAWFMDRLPPEPKLFNEYHALIVEHCKTFCRKREPLCADCPLLARCPFGNRRLVRP